MPDAALDVAGSKLKIIPTLISYFSIRNGKNMPESSQKMFFYKSFQWMSRAAEKYIVFAQKKTQDCSQTQDFLHRLRYREKTNC